MSTEAWIFMVGFRVFDIGLLVAWLVWFFRLRDDGFDSPEDEGGGGGGGPEVGPRRPSWGPGGLRHPLGPVAPGHRSRGARGPLRSPSRRPGSPPIPSPLPARVRSPQAPRPVRSRD